MDRQSSGVTVTPRVNIAATCDYWRRELRQLTGALERAVERIQQLEREISSFQSACGSRTLDGNCGISLTEPTVHAMDVRRLSNGSIEIALDGGRKFKLPPQLAEVFLYIASGEKNPGPDDPLVGWRTRTQILECLARSFGRTYQLRFVNNLIHRLKDILSKAGYSRGLIQTHRRKGVRLACRRGPSDARQAINP
jgi:hypothetical protein